MSSQKMMMMMSLSLLVVAILLSSSLNARVHAQVSDAPTISPIPSTLHPDAPTYDPSLPTANPTATPWPWPVEGTPSPKPSHPRLLEGISRFLTQLGIQSAAIRAVAYAPNVADPLDPLLYFSLVQSGAKMIGAYSFKHESARFVLGSYGQDMCNATIYNTTGRFFYNVSVDKFHSDPMGTLENGTTVALSNPTGLAVLPIASDAGTDESPAGRSHQLLIADGMPSSRIFWMRRDPLSFNFANDATTVDQAISPVSKSEVLRVVGRACNYTQHNMTDGAQILPVDMSTPETSPPPIGPPGHVAYRATTGQIFFTQGNFVGVAELSNPNDRSSPRVTRVFFGQFGVKGKHTDAFNNQTGLLRQQATSHNIGQILVSDDDTELFIAEGGMSLIRAVNLQTNVVRVVAGALERQFPPRNCSLNKVGVAEQGLCDPLKDLVLTWPTAIALHRDKTTNLRSLFIADSSMSVVYRLFLDNNTVIRFAGILPTYIWPNPNITKNNTDGQAYNVSRQKQHAFQKQALPPPEDTYEDGFRLGAILGLSVSDTDLFIATSQGVWQLGIVAAAPPGGTPLPSPPLPNPQTGISGVCTNSLDCSGHAWDVVGFPFVYCNCTCKARWMGTANCSVMGVTKTVSLPTPAPGPTTASPPTTAMPSTSSAPGVTPTTPSPPTRSRTVVLALPKKEQTVDPVAVETGKATVTAVVVAVGIIQTPTVATQGARGVLLLTLHQCETEFDEQRDWMNSILQLSIDDLKGLRYYGGAVVGNVCFVLVGGLLHFIASLGALQYLRRTHHPNPDALQNTVPVFIDAAAALRFPSMFFFPSMFLFQGTVNAAVVLIRHAPANSAPAMTLGGLGLTACFALFVLLGAFLLFNFRAYFVKDPRRRRERAAAGANVETHTKKRLLSQRQQLSFASAPAIEIDAPSPGVDSGDELARPLARQNSSQRLSFSSNTQQQQQSPSGQVVRNASLATANRSQNGRSFASEPEPELPDGWRGKITRIYLDWTEADGAWREPVELQCKRYGGLFKDYQPHVYYFAMLEVGSAFVLGLCDGLKEPGFMCNVVLIVACLVYVAMFFALLFLKPLLSRLSLSVFTFVAGLQATSSVLLVVAVFTYSTTVTRYADNLSLAALFIMAIVTFIDLVIRVGYLAKNFIVWLCTPKERRRKRNPLSRFINGDDELFGMEMEKKQGSSDERASNASRLLRSLLGSGRGTPMVPAPPATSDNNNNNDRHPFENFSFGGYDPNRAQDDDEDLEAMLQKPSTQPHGKPPVAPSPHQAPQRQLMHHEMLRAELDDFLNQGSQQQQTEQPPQGHQSHARPPPVSGQQALLAAAHAAVAVGSSSSTTGSSTKKTGDTSSSQGNNTGSTNNSMLTTMLSSGASSPTMQRVPSIGQWRASTSSFGSMATAAALQQQAEASGARRRRPPSAKPQAPLTADDL